MLENLWAKVFSNGVTKSRAIKEFFELTGSNVQATKLAIPLNLPTDKKQLASNTKDKSLSIGSRTIANGVAYHLLASAKS